MPAILLGLAEYSRAELPKLSLKNYFFERAPTNLQDQVALIPRPRIKRFGSGVGSGPIRGLFRKGNVLANAGNSGQIICLTGSDLYRVNQVTGVGTLIEVGVEGDLRMSAEGNESVVVLAMGTKVYETNGTTASQIAMPDGKFVAAVDTLNGYFLLASELGRFYWTGIGVTTVSALDYATAESSPDVLLTLKVIGDELWLFGRYSIEVWQPTGDLDLPFQRISGRIFGIGITGRQSALKMSLDGLDTVCWVGTDRKVYRTNPNPTCVSDNAMDARLKRVVDPTLLYAVADNWHGHDFYVLHIPGEGSFALDLQTGKWAERTSYGRDLFRANVSTIGPNNQPIFGDDMTSDLWEFAEDAITDGDDPVVFECSGLVELNGPPIRCNNVIIETATGRTLDPDADPMMNQAYSDDDGETFSDEDPAPLGRIGERNTKVMWDGLPMIERPGRIFRWRTTEPVTIQRAKYNESYR